MKQEKYEKWIPVINIHENLSLHGLHHNNEGFRILLRDEKTCGVLRILFDSFFSYRTIDKSLILNRQNENKGLTKWPLFIVKNSRFLQWLNEESIIKQFNKEPIHYALITPNYCIDVISSSAPRVEWLGD